MNSYGTEVTSNPTTTENTRTSLRRIARHDEPVFSNASILNSMEKFVRTVNDMEETILIPSRLLDLAVGDSSDKVCDKVKNKHGCGIRDTLAKTDLYRLYTIVTQMKTDLLWSQQSPVSHDDQTEIRQSSINKQREQTAASPSPVAQQQLAAPSESGSSPANGETNVAAAATTQHRSHERCPSTTSIDRHSLQSGSSVVSSNSNSDSESDIGVDSGLEGEEPSDRLAYLAAENFKRHLRGLHRSINHMTQAASYLTLRYQSDIGGGPM
ncbi:uncharacterized protein LOC106650213 isoform X1 [Trichogramma pretiosum]|uniref:uncharacterized protein LOC106650213 isoform X1 n=1 Tax=Trichogramma pretiosum TaxID=7493 RepID=UPI0006C9BC1E|nr:uncharacterized protein LOC106650213 isoform X1 [Trichogramma pretiosum]